MKRNGLFFYLLLLVVAACHSPKTTQGSASAEPATHDATASDRQFGDPVTAAGAISYAELVSRMQAGDTLAVKVKGTVEAVCQMKGCWMNMAGTVPMMVRFKDYGFFVPKDISGREVVLDGKAYYKVVPVDELRHYAEDAGKSEAEIAAITEPKRELSFEATGVLLLD